MASTSQQKARDGLLSALDVFIQVLTIAKDTCGIPPAQIAFGSASILLTMIRVRFYLFFENQLPTHVHASRIRWPTTRNTLIWGGYAAMYVKYYTGD